MPQVRRAPSSQIARASTRCSAGTVLRNRGPGQLEMLAEADRAVADREPSSHVLAAGPLGLGKNAGELLRRERTWRRQLIERRRPHEAIAANERLTPARVDHREHPARGVASMRAERERLQARNADELHRQRLRETPRRGDSHPQARERPGPQPHGDALEQRSSARRRGRAARPPS